MAKVAAGGPRLPDELVVWEILTRLPAKPLLRCRAVCRSWHSILTSDAKFLHAHHRRQPSLRLVTTGDRSSQERRIDALDHHAGERRPVARTTGGAKDYIDIHVLASCDGLLVLLAYGGLEICNPATRQRAPITLLDDFTGISGLYPHRLTRSYRLLVWFKKDGRAVFKVHTVGSSELRCVGEPPGPWASGDSFCKDIAMMERLYPNVWVDGRLYWQPAKLLHGKSKSKGRANDMLVFDTMAESFQHKLAPVEGGGFHELFEMNNGALGLYDTLCGTTDTADLWVLQDYNSWAWSLNHRIKLPVGAICVMPVLDPEGDVLVLTNKRESSFEQRHLQHISGANGNLLARYEWNDSLDLKRHRFKESLVHHDFFMEGNAGSMVEKPLFDGLSTVALVRDDNSEPH